MTKTVLVVHTPADGGFPVRLVRRANGDYDLDRFESASMSGGSMRGGRIGEQEWRRVRHVEDRTEALLQILGAAFDMGLIGPEVPRV